MCDTFYIRKADGRGRTVFFAKNSDRDPNEPQYMVFVPAGEVSKPKTYVEMPSYTVKHDVWLSKPSWIWGAEMGINRKGVSIGNEATFNKVSVDKTGVLGMDHLRVSLELGSTAREAMEIIIQNTERYGQGGNAGFEHPLYYHNSYLIMDPEEAYLLETVDRYYAYKKLDRNYHISNRISIKDDFDEISPQLKGKVRSFERRFTNPIVSYFAGAYHRENRGRELMKRDDYESAGVMAVLQDRHTGRVASMRNIGMIAGGFVSSQATASLLYDYDQELIWYTEGPCPEIQLFKPLRFELRQPAGQGHGEDNRVCGTAMSGRRNLFHQSYDEGEGTKSSGTATSGTHDSSRKICDQPRGTKSSGTAISATRDLFSELCDEGEGVNRWKYNNLLFRAVLNDYAANKDRLHPLRTEYQNRLFELSADETDGEDLYKQAKVINRDYIDEALKLVGEGVFTDGIKGGVQFRRYWSRENKALFEREEDGELKELYKRYLG